MYTHYFELTELPFSISPDPRYFFMSPRHREALEHLINGIRESGGFVLLTGEVGTGKTTLLRCLLAQQPEDVNIALVLNPRLNAVELLATICDELRIDYPTNTDSLKVLVDTLTEYLLAAHAKERRTVLIIDEAQNLSLEVLEQVRLLTNLETTQSKLLQIILVGQPELNGILQHKDLRQVTQRITCRYHLKSFSKAGLTAGYIHHRIAVSGGDASKLFTPAATRKIHRLSGGVPRLINLICHRALHNACSEQEKIVNAKLVRQATREVRPLLVRPWFRKAAYWAPALAAVFVAGIVGGYYLNLSGLHRFYAAPTADQLVKPGGNETLDRNLAQKTNSGALADEANHSTAPATNSSGEPSATANAVKPTTAPATNSSGEPSATADAVKPTTAPATNSSGEPSATADAVKPTTAPATNSSGEPSATAVAVKSSTTSTADSSGESLGTVNIDEANRSTASAADNEGLNALNVTATPTASEVSAEHTEFSKLLRDPNLTRDAAFARLFSQWEIGSKAEETTNDCAWALQKNLRCLFGNSSWHFMRRLNRPVILEFLLKDNQKRYATLVALDEHHLTLDLDAQRLTFPLEQVLPFWRGRYILLWKPLSWNMPLLYPGNISATVRRLRRQFDEIGMPVTAVPEDANLYDEELKRRVIAFQTSRGIRPDGVVGPHTTIHLNTVVNAPDIPMLERESNKVELTTQR